MNLRYRWFGLFKNKVSLKGLDVLLTMYCFTFSKEWVLAIVRYTDYKPKDPSK